LPRIVARTFVRVAPPRIRITARPGLCRPCWLGPARQCFHQPGVRHRVAVVARSPPRGGRWRRPSRLRALQRPTRSLGRDRVPGTPASHPASPARPASRARRGGARRLAERTARPSHRPGRAPLLRFMFPYSVRWPCRAVRCGRHPDDPAAAFVTVSPRPPQLPAASNVETCRCVRDAWRDGHPPLRFSACARRDDRVSPVVSGRAPVRTGHAPPLLHGRCSATRASRRTAWPVCPALPHRRRSWDSRPSRRCSRPRVSRRLRRSDPPAVSPVTCPDAS
jgi:hypothetical protein